MAKYAVLVGLVAIVALQSACRLGTPTSSSPTPSAVGSGGVVASAEPATVPAMYEPLYTSLNSYLDQDLALVGTSPAHYPAGFAAELIVADDNRGEALLDPQAFAATTLYLDRLQALGIRGVKLAVQYPLFTPSFPHYVQYLDFYRRVAQEVHRRGMVLTIQASILFANTPYSDLQYDYSNLTFSKYEQQDRDMIQTIIHEMQPEYIAIIAEPDTAAVLTGMPEFKDPQKAVELTRYVLSGLDRSTTKVCAGTGSWTSPQYARLLVERTNIDCVSIHIYPVNPDFIQNALTMAQDARASHKSVVVTEAWLYKVDRPGGGNQVAASPDAFKLDAFSFWAPLDQKFIQMMAALADNTQADVVSLFWSPFLFHYVDYQPGMENESYTELARLSNQGASQALTRGSYSSTGLYLQDLIKGR